eukprot:gnl/TRDRNA2_/TRDRNA2_156574_c0_seq1.p1 gnl/TRDRNA2_/TRDRNA2_156574_c0~~gnl/TRDRNA2_/TRDRNA2_156574_c0_seq1.p1  ORF type:complete len:619 (-),score=69.56 gnl/TRDRNA2_/TRDRNA2_156574_c0_seq1:124-1980(-)
MQAVPAPVGRADPALSGASIAAIYACCDEKRWEEALLLLREMREENVECGITPYSVTLSTCSQRSQWTVALGLLGQMLQQTLRPSAQVFISIVSCSSEWALALDLLVQMGPSEFDNPQEEAQMYIATIGSCQKAGQWFAALEVLRLMGHERIAPSQAAYSKAIDACGRGGKWAVALDIVQELKHERAEPNASIYAAAAVACEVCNQRGLALDLLRQVPRNLGAQIPFAQEVYWETAVLMLQRMRHDQVEPDRLVHGVVMNLAISACEGSSQWTHALSLLQQVRHERVQPDMYAYRSAVAALERASQQAAGLELLAEIESRRSPDEKWVDGPHVQNTSPAGRDHLRDHLRDSPMLGRRREVGDVEMPWRRDGYFGQDCQAGSRARSLSRPGRDQTESAGDRTSLWWEPSDDRRWTAQRQRTSSAARAFSPARATSLWREGGDGMKGRGRYEESWESAACSARIDMGDPRWRLSGKGREMTHWGKGGDLDHWGKGGDTANWGKGFGWGKGSRPRWDPWELNRRSSAEWWDEDDEAWWDEDEAWWYGAPSLDPAGKSWMGNNRPWAGRAWYDAPWDSGGRGSRVTGAMLRTEGGPSSNARTRSSQQWGSSQYRQQSWNWKE